MHLIFQIINKKVLSYVLSTFFDLVPFGVEKKTVFVVVTNWMW